MSQAMVMARLTACLISNQNASLFIQNLIIMHRFRLLQSTDHTIFVFGQVFNLFSSTSGILFLAIIDKPRQNRVSFYNYFLSGLVIIHKQSHLLQSFLLINPITKMVRS